MSTAGQQNEDTVRTCLTEASRGNYEVFDTILTPDYVVHPEEARGAAGLQEMVDGYRAALSNLRVDIEQQFSAGDRVATVSTLRGVHEGDLMGTPPTGREPLPVRAAASLTSLSSMSIATRVGQIVWRPCSSYHFAR